MRPFSTIIRQRSTAAATGDDRYEVVVLLDGEPVLLTRRRLELRDDWHLRDNDFVVWKTVDPPSAWVEHCSTLDDAKQVAAERATVLNRLAELFDSHTAVSLYREWDVRIP
jgi:Xaa-Pro aminopeptidase